MSLETVKHLLQDYPTYHNLKAIWSADKPVREKPFKTLPSLSTTAVLIEATGVAVCANDEEEWSHLTPPPPPPFFFSFLKFSHTLYRMQQKQLNT